MGIKLVSNFKDYYDHLFVSDSNTVYERTKEKGFTRLEDFNILKSLSISTLDMSQVAYSDVDWARLVVYTDPYAHGGKGKSIMDKSEAMLMYQNYLCTEYIPCDFYIKVVHVGSRKFVIQINKELNSLVSTGITSIKEVTGGYNRRLALPIFSIDYILKGESLVAIDLNRAENLGANGLNEFITAEQVIKEVENAFLAYNII